ncbi:MAG: hypothetical protein MO853_04185 [Candidatus Protistobacter heckmanni]|nr:hypothetical protein [Candidatus Protistobacter heckmanni]
MVLTNLRACFPDWSEDRVQREGKRGMLWFCSAQRLSRWVRVDDQAGLAGYAGKPHIMLCMHLMGIEAGALRLSIYLRSLNNGGDITLYTKTRD